MHNNKWLVKFCHCHIGVWYLQQIWMNKGICVSEEEEEETRLCSCVPMCDVALCSNTVKYVALGLWLVGHPCNLRSAQRLTADCNVGLSKTICTIKTKRKIALSQKLRYHLKFSRRWKRGIFAFIARFKHWQHRLFLCKYTFYIKNFSCRHLMIYIGHPTKLRWCSLSGKQKMRSSLSSVRYFAPCLPKSNSVGYKGIKNPRKSPVVSVKLLLAIVS